MQLLQHCPRFLPVVLEAVVLHVRLYLRGNDRQPTYFPLVLLGKVRAMLEGGVTTFDVNSIRFTRNLWLI